MNVSQLVTEQGNLFQTRIASFRQVLWARQLLPDSISLPDVSALVVVPSSFFTWAGTWIEVDWLNYTFKVTVKWNDHRSLKCKYNTLFLTIRTPHPTPGMHQDSWVRNFVIIFTKICKLKVSSSKIWDKIKSIATCQTSWSSSWIKNIVV